MVTWVLSMVLKREVSGEAFKSYKGDKETQRFTYDWKTRVSWVFLEISPFPSLHIPAA